MLRMSEIIFNDIKFVKDKKTGYYINIEHKKRLHRYVYEFYNGEIKKGCHIHHIDKNKDNNSIENLQMLTAKEHRELHKEKTEEEKQRYRDNLNLKARPKAIEWHKSEKGSEWHKEHYEKTKDKLHKKTLKKCENCGKEFENIAHSKFCCAACKAKYRRDSGKDKIIKECAYCGEQFETSKFKSAETCSRSCANKLRAVRKRNQTKK